LNRQEVPTRVILLVSAYALGGFALAYVVGWRAETLLFIPNSLGIATFIVGTAAGVRLLKGKGRWLAAVSFLLCIAVFVFAGASVFLPMGVALAAFAYRRLRRREKQREETSDTKSG
jgi:amino acid efflux transporter